MRMKKPLFNQICIVGVGLIGGSIGMAVKKKKLAGLVIGVARRKATLETALRRKAIDVGVTDLSDGVQNADLVILCAPVSVINVQLKLITPYLKKGAVVIDAGSSKEMIEATAKKHLTKNRFVGCHPMAGSEQGGVEHASGALFEGSVCFLTKPDPAIAGFWKALGAVPVTLAAAKHDAWAARASHLPHLLAFALFQDFKLPAPNLPVNPSLQGMARIAKSSPELWADILLSNRKNASAAIHHILRQLAFFDSALRSADQQKLTSLIRHANKNSPQA